MIKASRTCILTLVWVISCVFPSWATMGGYGNVGAIMTQGDSSTATREWIELKTSGDLLAARPDHDLLAMITVYAPGLQHGHIILRELTTRDGKRTLLLTAPDEVLAHVQRATLYTRGLDEDMVLFENVHGRWERRQSQLLVVASPTARNVSTEALRAFPVKTLGFYWLLESSSTPTVISHSPEATSARTLMGGEMTWGFLPSIFGIALFVIFRILSRYIHKVPKLREP